MLALSLIPQGIPDTTLFLIVGSLSAMVFGMSKTGFGSGISILAIPMMIYACSDKAALAVGIMLPILIVADYVAVITWWKKWNVKTALSLLPASLCGIALGWGALEMFHRMEIDPKTSAANAWLMLGIGLIALGFVALHIIKKIKGQNKAFKPQRKHTVITGLAAGFTSTLAHAAGPVITMYLLPQQKSKASFVATTAFFFWMANQIKLIPYLHQNMINTETLGAGLVLLPGIVAGAILGRFLHNRVGAAQFVAIVYTLLAVAGGHMCYKATCQLAA
ncbi:MAG: sulfite exporter TauE/SafE family protein [Phycisphaerales bacterium]|nr:sulfite exporter TauE/SafE family protein [Phycisphaerales bacterium]